MKNQKALSIVLLCVFALGGISFFISQCKPKTSSTNDTSTTNPKPETQNSKLVAAPDFDADSAFAFVAKQVSFGPRIPGTVSQTKCAGWLTSKLKTYTS